jgi:hypothetical protein
MSEVKDGIRGSEFWINSAELSFLELQNSSNLLEHWRIYKYIHTLCKDFGIFPVNKYVLDLYPKPELISIVDNTVTFRQRTHAEIWVEPYEDSLYALDKCWQRQFYPSSNKMSSLECFDPTYRFYIPWVPCSLDKFAIKPVVDEETPFLITGKELKINTPNFITHFYETEFVDFMIKKSGSHMVDNRYGIIDIGTAMYDMVVEMNEEQIEKIHKQYRN